MIDHLKERRLPNEAPSELYADLFRKEALNAAATRYGVPVSPIGITGWSLSLFMLLVFIGAVLFLVMSRYTRKESVTGILQPPAGAARVTSLRGGGITDVYVIDGQAVDIGDPILQLSADQTVRNEADVPVALSALVEAGSDREAQAVGDQAQARIETIERSLDDLHLRRDSYRKETLYLIGAAELLRDRLRLAEETYEAGKSLHERQLFSTLQLRQREEAVIAARQNLAASERERHRNDETLRRLDTEEGQLRAQISEADASVAVTRAQLEQRRAEHLAEHGTVLVAGKAGRIAALQARSGGTVQPGQALAIILPAGATLQAELWVPSRAVGFLRTGDQVRLMYDAFPYQKFGVGHGKIASVAGAPTDPADLPVPIETREGLYRVLVKIDVNEMGGYGRQWRLAPGMRLSADLVLDDRSLWEWLFEPIIAARRRGGSL